ncbi:hypothetical protein NMY22_g12506 [Coprinellus aureogranulatus]|nr:hypothetical protein NMY22_g12506 [Coprinellus aureogranulatus]
MLSTFASHHHPVNHLGVHLGDESFALCLQGFASMHLSPHTQASDINSHELFCEDDHLMETDSTFHGNICTGQSSSETVDGMSLATESRPIALELDALFVRGLHVVPFAPKTMRSRDIDLLFKLGRIVGPGLKRNQFRQIWRRCGHCRNFCFRERTAFHRCNGRTFPVETAGFNLVDYLFSLDEHAGLTRKELCQWFVRCGRCDNICMGDTLEYHQSSIYETPESYQYQLEHRSPSFLHLSQRHTGVELGGIRRA